MDSPSHKAHYNSISVFAQTMSRAVTEITSLRRMAYHCILDMHIHNWGSRHGIAGIARQRGTSDQSYLSHTICLNMYIYIYVYGSVQVIVMSFRSFLDWSLREERRLTPQAPQILTITETHPLEWNDHRNIIVVTPFGINVWMPLVANPGPS